jgi:hypothetical protein
MAIKKNGVCRGYSNDSAVEYYAKEFDMAEPKDLQEAADAIHGVRNLAAVQRHKELDDLLLANSASALSSRASSV